jgi:hypothetical protein
VKVVSACPICGSRELRHATHAIVAPFLARRIWGREAFGVSLVRCNACEFLFFNPRMESAEEARLYCGYRGADYLKARQAAEPWYTARFNQNLANPAFLELRKAMVARILQGYLPGDRSCKVLDFGGSHGELVSGLLPNCSSFVYDISGVEPLDGVTACLDLADCRRREFDLILCSNVLEHIGFPQTTVLQICQMAAPQTFIWIEVPQETPLHWDPRLRRLVQEALLLALRPRLGLSLLRPGMLHWMHEHVNFFNRKSLQELLRRSGCEVLDADTYEISGPTGNAKMLWIMAKLHAV